VMAQRGLPDQVARARPAAVEPERKVAAKKRDKAETRGGTALAKKDRAKRGKDGAKEGTTARKPKHADPEETREAKKKDTDSQGAGSKVAGKKGRTAVAAKKDEEERKPARVRHTFDAAKPTQKS